MKKRTLTALGSLVLIALLYQNCSQTPFGGMGMHAEMSSTSLESQEPNIVAAPVALLSAEQVFKSMSSVTGVTPTGGIVNEYNARQSLLGSGYDLKLVTSPMLMGITNLSSTFCNELLTKETALAADGRKFFSSIDFTKPVGTVSAAGFEATIGKLSQAFWGREASKEESEILMSGRTEFLAGLTDAEKNQNGSTRNLMLFTCSGMLSSFDSVTF